MEKWPRPEMGPVHDLFYKGIGVSGSVDTLLAIEGFGWPLFLVWGCGGVLSPWNFLRGWSVIVICLPCGSEWNFCQERR